MATAGVRYEIRTGNIWSYAHRGDITGLKAAVVRGVDVNLVNTVGWTACHAAAAGGQTKALRYLVKKMDADLSIADNGGNLVVHHAAKNGHLHALRTLEELGADITKVRLSQAKGKDVRELVIESYRKANKEVEDGNDDVVEAVGYARKQSKSTAFWGPRRTPISCAIKKKIIKDKRKMRKEKLKAMHECNNEKKEIDLEEEQEKIKEDGEEEPSYQETVQQIKRSRKQKRRQRQKSQSHAPINEKEDPVILNIDRYEIDGGELKSNDRKESTTHGSFRSLSDSGHEDSDDEDDMEFRTSSIGRFAALALTEDDSDSE